MPGQERGKDERPPPDSPGRIYFVNLFPRPPVFTRDGYTEFATIGYVAWALLLVAVTAFDVEFTISESLVTSLAGSSVEMAALSIALLALLHQLSRADIWFKLALLLVSSLFVSAVLAGFAIAATWKDSYEEPHVVTLHAAAVLFLAGILHVPLHGRLARWEWRGGRIFSVIQKLKWVPRLVVATGWVAPFVAVWATGVRPSSAVLLLFCGATLSVLALVLVAIVRVVRPAPAPSPAETLLALELGRAQEELAKRDAHSALRTECLAALESRAEAARSARPVPLIPLASLMAALRERKGFAPEQSVEAVLRELVGEGLVFRVGYHGDLWPVPPASEVAAALEAVRSLALVYTRKSPESLNGDGWIGGFHLPFLGRHLAGALRLPGVVAWEFLLPNVVQLLADEAEFTPIGLFPPMHVVLVNRRWLDSDERRARWCAALARARSNGALDRRKVVDRLPQTKDAVPMDRFGLRGFDHKDAEVLDVLLTRCPEPPPMDDGEPW